MPDEKPKHSNEKSVACFEYIYFWTYLLLNKTHQNLCLVLGPVLCTFLTIVRSILGHFYNPVSVKIKV